ncbi:MAG TPA: alginate lyase family protein [Pyrinomonadaceae bacterium]|jgi:hypothetical protein|nr:alginate lyase family protein [Pyrinomonadaceae bacterium]
MKVVKIQFLMGVLLAACLPSYLTAAGQAVPKTIVLDGKILAKAHKAYMSKLDPDLIEAVKKINDKADGIVKAGKTYSVMSKAQLPASGDKHDYMSQAPYWWPDPAKPNNLPYIRRDGQRNPELSKITDSIEKDRMLDDAETLSLAYFFTGDEKYAAHAATVIRAWFLDPKTKQNPNLNFSQGIPGISTGRGIGLIETRELYRVIDSSILLEGSKAWTRSDREGLKKWFGDFLGWMIDSPIGRDEADELNNHGTYYDVQAIAYAIFTGRRELAIKQLNVTKDRIRTQIEPDGSQPKELVRTLSWGYANMNLAGFFTLARLAESVGVDLWNYKTADGRGIRQAFIWLLPFVQNEKKWTYEQIKPRVFGQTVHLLNIAARKYQDPEYRVLAKRLGVTSGENDLGFLDL